MQIIAHLRKHGAVIDAIRCRIIVGDRDWRGGRLIEKRGIDDPNHFSGHREPSTVGALHLDLRYPPPGLRRTTWRTLGGGARRFLTLCHFAYYNNGYLNTTPVAKPPGQQATAPVSGAVSAAPGRAVLGKRP